MRRLLRSIPVVLACLLCGCPQDISGIEDPTADGGGATDGPVIPWLPADGGKPQGDTDGGTDPLDAGEQDSDAGTSNDLRWAEMTLPVKSGLYDVHGNAHDNVYAVGSTGYVHRYDGSGWKQAHKNSTNADLNGVWVSPAGGVYIAGGAYPTWCTGNCHHQDSYQATTVASCGLVAACGRGSTIWLIGNKTNNELCGYKFNGTTWDNALNVSAGLGANVRRCYVADDGALYITAQWRILRSEDGSTGEEPTDLDSQEKFGVELNAIFGAGGVMYAAGTDNRILKRQPGGDWKHVFQPSGTGDDFRALTGVGALELFAGGTARNTGHQFARVGTTGWRFIKDGPRMDVWGMWAASDGLVFAVGNKSNSSEGMVLRGIR